MDTLRKAKPANGTRQLVDALNNTYDMRDMNDVYKVEQGRGDGNLGAVCSLDPAGRIRMTTRLL